MGKKDLQFRGLGLWFSDAFKGCENGNIGLEWLKQKSAHPANIY